MPIFFDVADANVAWFLESVTPVAMVECLLAE
jgi:hypothetical protein